MVAPGSAFPSNWGYLEQPKGSFKKEGKDPPRKGISHLICYLEGGREGLSLALGLSGRASLRSAELRSSLNSIHTLSGLLTAFGPQFLHL